MSDTDLVDPVDLTPDEPDAPILPLEETSVELIEDEDQMWPQPDFGWGSDERPNPSDNDVEADYVEDDDAKDA